LVTTERHFSNSRTGRAISALSGNVDEAALKDRFRIDEGTAPIPCVRRFGLVSLSIVLGCTAINTGIFKERAGYEGLLYKLLPPAAARKLKAGKVVSEATYQRARDYSKPSPTPA
jgi:hypothetical protein